MMTLIRYKITEKDPLTGKDVLVEKIEVAGTNVLMRLACKSIPYEVVGRYPE